MKDHMISVIIPVYQVKDYLEATLESLLSQQDEDWEAILVDDGSWDGSEKICDVYAQKDSRIRVIHQKNQGVSAARNQGIQLAEGAYIAFLDSDDLLAPDYLARLRADMEQNQADVVCCNATLDRKGEREVYKAVLGKRLIQSKAVCFEDFLDGKEYYGHGMFGKMIKTELARKCPFKPLKIGEDKLFMLEVFNQQPRVFLDDYAGYIYVRREDSATMGGASWNSRQYLDLLEADWDLLQMTADLHPDIQGKAVERYGVNIHNGTATVAASHKNGIFRCPEEFRAHLKQLQPHWGQLSLKTKIRLWLLENLPAGYYLTIKLLQIAGRMGA